MILLLHQIILYISEECFRKNIKTNHDNSWIVGYNINREAAKISVLASGKIDKYEYLIDETILPSNRSQIIKQTKFKYSPLGNVLKKKQTKKSG